VTVPAAIAGSAIAAGALAFVLVALLTEVMRRVAIRHRLIDRPRTDRIHASATPFLGGVAIVGGTLGAVAVVVQPDRSQTLAITLAAASVAILGLIDDLRHLSPRFRLIAECLVASALVASGVHVNVLAGMPVMGRLTDYAGTVAWIVVVTNSFNLLDNMDGVAAAIAFVTSSLLATMAFAIGRPDLAGLLIAISAGCAGFLAHNWTPARIFMGDAGSLFLGFVISASAVLTCDARNSAGNPITTVACTLLLLTFVAVVDTCTVVVSRSRAGRQWTQGGADHLSHRMRAAGLGTARIVIVLSLAAGLTGTLGLMVITGIVPAQGFLAATVTVGVALVALAQKIEVYRPRGATLVDSSSRYPAREQEHEHDMA
jgi:UDP-GlcNAc:undecaprenyl-phosphate/decaprenyl-phosphate GlcNAc-1-phosphate transferase